MKFRKFCIECTYIPKKRHRTRTFTVAAMTVKNAIERIEEDHGIKVISYTLIYICDL